MFKLYKPNLKIGSRKSALALRQAEYVKNKILALHPGQEVEIIGYQTSGDKIKDQPLYDIGGKGLFIKELEIALKKGEIDFAVQSVKDIPSQIECCFDIPIVFPRENPLDAFISHKYASLDELPATSKVGTSSPRRTSQLLCHKKDLLISPLRGNIETRLAALKKKKLDAILLAVAGLKRMGWAKHITQIISPTICLPAVGQGIIGLECLKENKRAIQNIATLNHQTTYLQLLAERSFLAKLNGNCNSPIAANAILQNKKLVLKAFAGNFTGEKIIKGELSGLPQQAIQIGISLANQFIKKGIKDILAL